MFLLIVVIILSSRLNVLGTAMSSLSKQHKPSAVGFSRLFKLLIWIIIGIVGLNLLANSGSPLVKGSEQVVELKTEGQ